MAVGRPSKYKEEFCEELIEHMAEGYSYEAFAGRIGTCKQTLYDWEKANPEFLDAKRTAFERSRFFWEKQGIDGVWAIETFSEEGKKEYSKKLNSTAWIFNMKNRFNWTDKKDVTHGGDVKINLGYSLDEDEEE